MGRKTLIALDMDAATIYHAYVIGKATVQAVTAVHCCMEVYSKGHAIYRVLKPLKKFMKRKDEKNYDTFVLVDSSDADEDHMLGRGMQR